MVAGDPRRGQRGDTQRSRQKLVTDLRRRQRIRPASGVRVLIGSSGPTSSHDVLTLVERSDGSTVWTSDAPGSSVFSVAISPDGSQGYAGESGGDEEVRAIAMADGSQVWAFTGTKGTPRGLAADGSWVYAGTAPGTGEYGVVHKLAASTGALEWTYDQLDGFDDIFSLALTPDGTRVIVGAEGDDSLHAIDADGSQAWTVASIDRIFGVAATDSWVYVGGSGQQVEQRATSDGSQGWTYSTGAWVRSVAVSPDGATVYAGDQDGVTHALDAADGSVRWTKANPSGFTAAIHALAADASAVIAGDDNGNVFNLAPADGTVKWTREQTSTINALALTS